MAIQQQEEKLNAEIRMGEERSRALVKELEEKKRLRQLAEQQEQQNNNQTT
jgi:hypothetical protein